MSETPQPPTGFPTLEELQRWTFVIGRTQQMLMEHGLEQMRRVEPPAAMTAPPSMPDLPMFRMMQAGVDLWADGMKLWAGLMTDAPGAPDAPGKRPDKRFAAPAWRENPLFDSMRQTYELIADHMLKGVDRIEGVSDADRERIRFATRGMVDAMSPSNFAWTNPEVIEKTLETRGENLLKGLEHMLRDIGRGQLTQTQPDAFEIGRNIATTPGKVVKETPLYQLIQYSPATDDLLRTPLVIFPPWINRFYILDLNEEKSFIRWAVEQGLTVFVVSWKSADAFMAELTWDDYIVGGVVDAVDTVRDLLDVEAVHTIGYCVAGTTLAAALAVLAAHGEGEKVASATFFTAQVDFAHSGDLGLFIDDQMKLAQQLSGEGFLDGRYMAATFNTLRGRDLIWNYVTNNYLLGKDYAPFDLLHWNSDVTNLPAKWHQSYLADLYRDNRLVEAGSISVGGTPIDLRQVKTPSYVQAGREDHIAPAESVWKITDHFAGPVRFVLAGSGHIAGVVNPPSSGKYQYWTNEGEAHSLAEFVAGATETKGSWWPDWFRWIEKQDGARVEAKGARVPGEGKLPAIEDAPGRYVRTR